MKLSIFSVQDHYPAQARTATRSATCRREFSGYRIDPAVKRNRLDENLTGELRRPP